MIRASFKGGRKFRSIIPSRKQYSIRLASSKMAELERFAEENNLNAEIVLTIFDDEDNSVLFRESFSVGEGISNNLLFLVSRTLDTTFKDSPQEEKDALLQMLSKAMEEEAVEQECNKKLFSVPNLGFFKGRKKNELDPKAAEAERARQAEEKARQEAAEAERARQAEEKARQEAAEAERARQAEEKARQEAAEAERARQAEEKARQEAAEAERARQAEEKARQEAAEAERARQAEEEARQEAAEAERARQAEEKARQEAAEAERARQAEEIVEENKKGKPAAAVKTHLSNGFSKGIAFLKKQKQYVPDRKNKREIHPPIVAQESAAMRDLEKQLKMAKIELIEEIKKEKLELDKKLAKEKKKEDKHKKALAKRRKRMAAPGLGSSKLILFAILLIIGVQVYFNVESGNSPLTVPGWVIDIGNKVSNLVASYKKL
ncbi:hypothetical protein [Bacillus subtilis]|uniref:hypothetical protein n=1 Tax=Bacillus subtilis TaxID=1423 RepID=UPI002ADE655B|nr:hypothetical protein [Bacillus subtilis]WQF01768.1 hypothetical protein U1R71_21985 [Bacillus subtilis]